MLDADVIGSLNAEVIIQERPDPLPSDFRPLWRMTLLLLILSKGSRGQKCSLLRLQMLDWAVRKPAHLATLHKAVLEKPETGSRDALFRRDASLGKALALALGEGLLAPATTDVLRFSLTDKGKLFADQAVQSGCFSPELETLKTLKQFTEGTATALSKQ